MKNPIAVFSLIAVAAAAAIGTTFFVNSTPDVPQQPVALAQPETAAVPLATPETAVIVPPAAIAPEVPVVIAQQPVAPAIAAPSVVAETPLPPLVEIPATTVIETPVQQQAAAAPAPVVESLPAPPEAKTTDVPLQPAPAVVALPPVAAVVAPSFDTVRVEATGDAVIAGRAEPLSEITVKWNGNIVGTTTANADGAFVLVPAKALKTGIGAMTVEMTNKGKVTVSDGSVFVVVKKDAPAMVAKVDPVAPTQVLQTGEVNAVPKELQLTAVDYDAAGNIVFSGVAAPGTTVRFYVDNAATGEGKADAHGKWSFAGTSTVTPGTHMLRADAVDTAGLVVRRIELPFLRESAETVAAAKLAAVQPAPPTPVVRSIVPVEPPVAGVAVETPVVAAPVPALASPPEVEVATAPVPATPVAPAAPVVIEQGPQKLVIQPGNNLWKLSREVYGKGRMFTVIYEANRDQVKDPNMIFPGQILTAPKQN